MSEISYDVVVHAIERRRNANRAIISYRLSWRVENEVWKRTFRTAAQAESFRSEMPLRCSSRRGVFADDWDPTFLDDPEEWHFLVCVHPRLHEGEMALHLT